MYICNHYPIISIYSYQTDTLKNKFSHEEWTTLICGVAFPS